MDRRRDRLVRVARGALIIDGPGRRVKARLGGEIRPASLPAVLTPPLFLDKNRGNLLKQPVLPNVIFRRPGKKVRRLGPGASEEWG
jgi:hypothetical protein